MTDTDGNDAVAMKRAGDACRKANDDRAALEDAAKVLGEMIAEAQAKVQAERDRLERERVAVERSNHVDGIEAPLVASTLQTLVQLVDAGLGFTLLPAMAVEAGMLHGTRVRSQAVDGPAAERQVALAWRRGHARGGEFGLLGETIRAAVR